jgi:hypothetical protein
MSTIDSENNGKSESEKNDVIRLEHVQFAAPSESQARDQAGGGAENIAATLRGATVPRGSAHAQQGARE